MREKLEGRKTWGGRESEQASKNTAKVKQIEKWTSHCLCAILQTAAQREWEDRASTPFKLNSLPKYFSDELSPLCCSLQSSHPFLCSGRATLQLWQVGWPEGRKDWLGCFKVMLSCWDVVVCLFSYKLRDDMTWHDTMRHDITSHEKMIKCLRWGNKIWDRTSLNNSNKKD